MHPSLKPLHDQVMVITGASSGIGLATAKEAACRGARLVLTARNGDALEEITAEINAAGGEATCVTADISRREDVQLVAETAIERFGRIDTWVNNAGVSIWGKLEEVSDDDNRQLFDINFWGTVNGSLTALPHLKRQGGALINVGSVASDFALPLQGMYSASKHAVRGFTDALRQELQREGTPVSVTLIKPTSINTPLPQRAKAYTREEPKLPPPVYQPEEVAAAILRAATHPVRDIYVGGGGRLMAEVAKLLPRVMDWLGRNVIMEQELRDEPRRIHRSTLYQAGDDRQVHGEHPGYVMKSSLYTRAAAHPLATTAAVAAAGLAAWALLSDRPRSYRADRWR